MDRAADEAVSEARKVAQASEDYRALQARVDRLELALSRMGEITDKVRTIEQYEDWEGGEPSIGTCKILGEIKRISDQARSALAESEAIEKPQAQ